MLARKKEAEERRAGVLARRAERAQKKLDKKIAKSKARRARKPKHQEPGEDEQPSPAAKEDADAGQQAEVCGMDVYEEDLGF